MEKVLPGGDIATLDLSPGLFTGMLSESPAQTLGDVVVGIGGPAAGEGNERRRTLGALRAIDFSELVADLEGLR
jgi:hypothetical protein